MKTVIFFFLLYLLFPHHAEALTQTEIDTYIWRKQVVKNISTTADPLRQTLSQEVKKAIAAGHLAPYYINQNELKGHYFWFHAGEPIYTYSEALKYLPTTDTQTKTDLKNFLKSEITQYSPYIPTAVYDRAPWLPVDKGTRREWYRLALQPVNSTYMNQGFPVIQTFYHTWTYVDATGDTSIITNDWTKIKNLWDKLKDRSDVTWMDRGGCIAKYGDVAGCVGMARLAYLKNDPLVVDEAISRTTAGFTNGLDFATFEDTAAKENRYFIESHTTTIRNYVYLNLFPETAKFIRDKNITAATTHVNQLIYDSPTWFLTYSIGYRGGEVNMNLPFMTSTIFQAQAMIMKKDAAYLSRHIGTPIAKAGDLDYMQKLVSAIKAHGQTCWVDIRNNSETCE